MEYDIEYIKNEANEILNDKKSNDYFLREAARAIRNGVIKYIYAVYKSKITVHVVLQELIQICEFFKNNNYSYLVFYQDIKDVTDYKSDLLDYSGETNMNVMFDYFVDQIEYNYKSNNIQKDINFISRLVPSV